MLFNNGFHVTGSPVPKNEPASIIVVGLSRGGTSAIAKSLHTIGISMGKRFDAPIYEDIDLAQALRAKDWDRLKFLIRQRESDKLKFAWKCPDIHHHLDRINKLFKNPHYVFVYRDILAVSMRRNLVHGTNLTDAINSSLVGYQNILQFVQQTKPNALHVSFEKLLHDKKSYAETLLDFCGIESGKEQVESIMDAVTAYPDSYTQWARHHTERQKLKRAGFDGCIDTFTRESVSGWLLKKPTLFAKETPLVLEVFLNGSFVASVVADLHRQDLVEAGLSKNGNAGFRVNLSNFEINANDTVCVRVHGCGLELSSRYTGKASQ